MFYVLVSHQVVLRGGVLMQRRDCLDGTKVWPASEE